MDGARVHKHHELIALQRVSFNTWLSEAEPLLCVTLRIRRVKLGDTRLDTLIPWRTLQI